jgi:DNA-binding NarL/FixJ family response regulator
MRSRDAAFVRKLCTLGLPARSLAVALLPALRQLVPAHSGGVFWVDAAGQMSGLYAERMLPPDAMAAYYERHYDRRGDGFAEAFRQRAAAADPVSSHSFSRAEQATDYFRDVLQPLDAFHVLYGVLNQQGRPIAQLSLYRGAADRPFSRDDASVLRGLIRYLSMGLAEARTTPTLQDASVVVEEAVGVVSPAGEVIAASEAWRRLIRLAAVAEVAPSQAARERAVIEDFLRQIGAEAQSNARRTGIAELVRQNAWGRFTIRPFLLQDVRGRRGDQLALLLRREEPRSLSLVRGTGNSDLAPQQREVALLLAQGKTNPEIAQALGLTLNTASYHVKQVYLRLQVNDRDAVQGELLRRAQSAVAA